MVTYGYTINRLQGEAKGVIRQRENITKKLCNAELAVTFNKTCIKENLLPVYTLNIPRDEAASNQHRGRGRPSDEERRGYMKRRIIELKSTIEELRQRLEETQAVWNQINIEEDLKNEVEAAFKNMIDVHRNSIIQQNQRKLVNLNGGSIKYPRPSPGYINLTNKPLTPAQEEILNMGLNCHIMSKPTKFQKRIECEMLIGEVEKLATQGKVTVEPTFKQEITTEAAKTRGNFNSQVLKRNHIEAAKELRADPEITIRRADKTASYVII